MKVRINQMSQEIPKVMGKKLYFKCYSVKKIGEREVKRVKTGENIEE